MGHADRQFHRGIVGHHHGGHHSCSRRTAVPVSAHNEWPPLPAGRCQSLAFVYLCIHITELLSFRLPANSPPCYFSCTLATRSPSPPYPLLLRPCPSSLSAPTHSSALPCPLPPSKKLTPPYCISASTLVPPFFPRYLLFTYSRRIPPPPLLTL